MMETKGHVQAPLSYISRYYIDDMADSDSSESRFYQGYLDVISGGSVLNVACGPQFYNDMEFFGSKPKEYVGLDINRNTMRFLRTSRNPLLLRAKANAAGVNVILNVGSILEFFPEYERRFDSVLSIAALGMFKREDFKVAVRNIHSYLKLGGVFLDADWTDSALSKETYIEKSKYRFYTRDGPSFSDQRGIIRDAGFSIIKSAHYLSDKSSYKRGRIFVYVSRKYYKL